MAARFHFVRRVPAAAASGFDVLTLAVALSVTVGFVFIPHVHVKQKEPRDCGRTLMSTRTFTLFIFQETTAKTTTTTKRRSVASTRVITVKCPQTAEV